MNEISLQMGAGSMSNNKFINSPSPAKSYFSDVVVNDDSEYSNDQSGFNNNPFQIGCVKFT